MEKRIILNNQETSYFIDDTGRVRNERTNTWYKGAVNKGYRFVNLYFRGKQYTLYIHRLVASYFLDNPDNLPIVHHKDGNRLNNCVWNLQWVSSLEHSEKHPMSGTKKSFIHIKTDEQDLDMETLRQFRESPYYVSKTGEVFNLEKKIKLRIEKTGNYCRVQCHYNLKGKHFLLHRVVWESFNGPIPKGKEVDHIDKNPQNNNLDNLRLVDHRNNCEGAKHKNKPVYSVDVATKERTDYSSINQASLSVLGHKGGRYIPNAIANGEVFKNCFWYYKE